MHKKLVVLIAMLAFAGIVDGGVIERWLLNKPQPPTPPMIRLLIAHDMPGVGIEVKGKYRLYDPKTNEHLSTRFVGKKQYLEPMIDGITWGEEFPDLHQIMIVPDKQDIATVVEGIPYHGNIYVYDIGGTISVVNETFIEDYLNSWLPTQYRPGLASEALAALAIAARTNVYYQSLNPKSPYWDIDARNGAYKGFSANLQSHPILAAINATQHLILSKDGSKPVPFVTQWDLNSSNNPSMLPLDTARISLREADDLARKGEHAIEILRRAFPGTRIIFSFQPNSTYAIRSAG